MVGRNGAGCRVVSARRQRVRCGGDVAQKAVEFFVKIADAASAMDSVVGVFIARCDAFIAFFGLSERALFAREALGHAARVFRRFKFGLRRGFGGEPRVWAER